jgi:ribosome maturation factor RimP
MASSDRIRRIQEVVAPVLERASVELVDIRLLTQKGRRVLRLYIDKAGGVNLHDCATISREVAVQLDVNDIIPGRYTLEVSSPGLDRPLRKASDYQRNTGRILKVTARGSDGVQHQLKGELISCEADGIVLNVKGEKVSISFRDIQSAKIQPRFS